MATVEASSHRNTFMAQGFTALRGVVDTSVLDEILAHIVRVLWRYPPESRQFLCADQPWNTDAFHECLLRFRKTEPGRFSALYDTVQSAIPLKRLVTDPRIVETVAHILSVDVSECIAVGEQIRMDAPFDQRNSYGWHQERSYYPANRNSEHCIVCWIPLLDVPEEEGPLEVCSGSHREGFLPVSKMKREASGSEQFQVPETVRIRYDAFAEPIVRGSALFTHMLLFHRSGENRSRRFRFSAIGRYHVVTADDFLPFRTLGHHNAYMLEQFRVKGDLLQDITQLNSSAQPYVAPSSRRATEHRD